MNFTHVLAGALVFASLAAPAVAETEVNWFVLRNPEVGNCWTATLVRIDGQYTQTFQQKAGGPYDKEEQAQARLKELTEEKTCNHD